MKQEDKFPYYPWKWGDRYDGWRVRKMDAVFRVIPYILRTRIDAQNFFEEKIPIDHIEEFIKKHKEEIPELSLMHVVMAALVRVVSQRPHLNRFVVWVMLSLDKVGMLPRFINEASPWHCSIFLTNIGSIGVESIYHHLYEFGTCSNFVAMGKKSRYQNINSENGISKHKQIRLKFVIDERICDGFYYASSMRLLNRLLAKPEKLLTPPEKIVIDEGVGRKPLCFD
jgi:hypothetical protein